MTLSHSCCHWAWAILLAQAVAFPSIAQQKGTAIDLAKLPFVDATKNTELVIQQLEKETGLGENTAIQVKLPPPTNRKLSTSLVRVIGDEGHPVVLFKSDALVKLGLLKSSPGKEFFTLFGNLSQAEIGRRLENEKALGAGKFGEVTREGLIFSGRSPVARTTGLDFDFNRFRDRLPFPLNFCPLHPVSTPARWDESLLVTNPAVVQNPARTWDPCTGAGTQGGLWTFAHLMREMAQGSGTTAEDFVVQWLSTWLNPQSVNSDSIPARTQMFSQVIAPWAAASGVSASLSTSAGGVNTLTLSGPLNLNIAPFRLLAIVNRIDLGKTASGGGGYGGTVGVRPVDAGELRFVFGVVQPNPWGAGTEATCGKKPFTVIFEYGVPVTGCSNVVAWANRWTTLNTLGGFTPAYLAQLESITQSVVVHGAAPAKGNQNAINQIRTNEIALSSPWELREFTLSQENPLTGADLPLSGLLRPHTVAQTPNDGAFDANTDATISSFVLGPVRSGLTTPVVLPGGATPAQCSANYTVPYSFSGLSFRGGNALTLPPTHWEAIGANPALSADVCARHEFSLNTCNGCHFADTSTGFTHISPTSGIPAALSGFLTGGGAGSSFNVADSQFGSPQWPFADLNRRFSRLYDLSQCTSCTRFPEFTPGLVNLLAELALVVPIDPIDPAIVKRFKFEIGPITDLSLVARILEARQQFASDAFEAPLDVVGPRESFRH
jgi:hypothetical protein